MGFVVPTWSGPVGVSVPIWESARLPQSLTRAKHLSLEELRKLIENHLQSGGTLDTLLPQGRETADTDTDNPRL